MNVSRVRHPALMALSLLAIAGCRQSRINDAEAIDVCHLVSAAEAERVLGPAAASPAPTGQEPGFAGGCTWSFQTGDAPARLSAQVMTQKSAFNLLTTPQDWFENPAVVGDAKANLGEPSELKGLGFVAYLYGTRLFVRKGAIVIILSTDRGEVAQMEQVARTLLN